MHLRHLLPALALLLLAPHASAQTRAVVAAPGNGVLVWPAAEDFANANGIVTSSNATAVLDAANLNLGASSTADGSPILTNATLPYALDGLGSPILTEATLPDSPALATFALQRGGNFSDVPDIALARTNLGLGTGDSPSFAALTVGGSAVVTAADLPTASVAYATEAGSTSNALFSENANFAASAETANTAGTASNALVAQAPDPGTEPDWRTALSTPKITVSADAPSAPAEGDLWLNNDGGSADLYIYALGAWVLTN